MTAPGVSIVRSSGGPSPFAWPGMTGTEAEEKEKEAAKAEMTPEQKALADHDVASTLE